MASIHIIAENCIGCQKCRPACPFGAIEIRGETAQERKAVILDNCTLCGACVAACKFDAIALTKDEQAARDLSAYQGVWVFCEQQPSALPPGKLRPVGLELLGQGRRIADELATSLTAVLIGAEATRHVATLAAHGADRVLLVEDPLLAQPDDLLYADVLADLAANHQPSIILLGATSFGRSLAPRVAARLETGLTADCTVLETDAAQGLLLQTRPAFGGNVLATIITPKHRPQMATVRPKVFAPLEPDFTRKAELVRVPLRGPRRSACQILEQLKGAGESVNIGEADILVAVGRGIGSAKNIARAEELARRLGGALAVSRPLVDNGWYGYSHQVGQTGKTVAPKLYLALGISGAIQHLAGVAAETVVAVNSDPDAPIFNAAHFALRGDCLEFIESMIEEIKNRRIQAV